MLASRRGCGRSRRAPPEGPLPVVLRLAWRHLSSKPRQTALTVAGVALGGVVCLIAALGPANGAARLEPTSILREER